jgi:hypothetical protein
MKLRNRLTCTLFVVFLIILMVPVTAQLKTPREFFGFEPGSDRNLITYEQLIEYLQVVDKESSRVYLKEIGKSPEGRSMYIAFISRKENIYNLPKLKEINEKLALDPDLPGEEREVMIRQGKVFVLSTMSMHSTEVAPSQAVPLIACDLATTKDSLKLKWLEDVVLMIVPCHNPDGMDKVVNHYLKYKGTKYEGSSMPGVYHKYVGHDNNRDFVTLSQEDTRAIARIYNLDWFPQVMVEKHQMGSTSARYFVPPNHDPIAENVPAEVWNWTGVFGSNMAKDMTREGCAGVAQHYLFDDYWPGSTETCIWKNVIGMLTEGASAKVATPVYIEPTELGVHGKGLSEYKKSINMTLPWEGGWWRLSDLVKYEKVSLMSIVKTSSLHREDILKFRNEVCRDEVERGRTQAPYYYIMPAGQHDKSEMVKLVNLLMEHGISVYILNKDVSVNNHVYPAHSIVVPLSQPFRPFIKEVMEDQEYPVRHYTPGGKIIEPYDITSWSLPLHFGVKSVEIQVRSNDLEEALEEITSPFSLNNTVSVNEGWVLFPVQHNESYLAAFKLIKEGVAVERLTSDLPFGNATFGKGSFVAEADSKTADRINRLVKTLSVDPVALESNVEFESAPVKMPRIALVETNFHDMDAGWTRFVFDSYMIPYKVVKPGDFEKTEFTENFDVIIFPSSSKSILMEGKYGSAGNYYITSYPPEYTKGIGKEGMKKLMNFIGKGGHIIAWGSSTELFKGALSIGEETNKEEFQLPFSDVSEQLIKQGLNVPGSLVNMKVTNNHPVTSGLEKEIGVFYRGQPVLTTSVPNFDMDRRVLGITPEKDILRSGYIDKEELLGNKPLMIWMKKDKAQFVFFAFNPQFRASTHVSFKLLFNAILLDKL